MESDDAVREIMNEELDGLITFGSSPFAEELRKTGLPLVIFEPARPDLQGNICFDYDLCGYECGKELLKENRKNLVFLFNHPIGNFSYYIDGLRRAYAEAGVPLDEKYFFNKKQNPLDYLQKILSSGAEIDTVIDTMLTSNAVANMIKEIRPELVQTCALVRPAFSDKQDAGFHEICFEIPFEQYVENATDMLMKQINNESDGLKNRTLRMPVSIRKKEN